MDQLTLRTIGLNQDFPTACYPTSSCHMLSEANQRPGGNLYFPIGPKITNCIEDVEYYLLPMKFRKTPFSRCR